MIKMSSVGDILVSVVSNDTDKILFLHNTRHEETAVKIMKEGFRFEEQLTYSSDRINPSDSVEINYFLVERKEYGKFTIVLEIDKSLFRKYNYLAEKSDISFEELISITIPSLSDNDEFIYTLDPHYIKGYLDSATGRFHANKTFDPSYESPVYVENFNRLKGQK